MAFAYKRILSLEIQVHVNSNDDLNNCIAIYNFLHSAKWLQRSLQAQQLGAYSEQYYDDDKRDDKKQGHCDAELFELLPFSEVKVQNSQVVATERSLPKSLHFTRPTLAKFFVRQLEPFASKAFRFTRPKLLPSVLQSS